MEDRKPTPPPTPATEQSTAKQSTTEPPQTIEQLLGLPAPPQQPPPSRWRWLPRFSLLNLLLFTTLIALAAAFVAMKTSLQRQLREQQETAQKQLKEAQRETWLKDELARADEMIHQNITGFPSWARPGTIRVQANRDPQELPGLVVILDPSKDYALRCERKSSNELKQKTVVIPRIDSPNPARKVLFLRFSRESLVTLRCMPCLMTFEQKSGRGSFRTDGLFPPLPPLQIEYHQNFGEGFFDCFTLEKKLLADQATTLFRVSGKNAAEEVQSLQLTIEEVTDADIKLFKQPQFFRGFEPGY